MELVPPTPEENRFLISLLMWAIGVSVPALVGAVVYLYKQALRRQRKDDQFRQEEAVRTNDFIRSTLEMTRAIDRNTEVVRDNTQAIQRVFTDVIRRP